MKKLERKPEPELLAVNGVPWGLEWEQRQAKDRGSKFNWRQSGGVPVNHLLLPALREQTQDHCSFCDSYPVCPPSDPTIEHLRPKAIYPRDAYRWANLYFCCRWCQAKGTAYDDALVLRPDEPDYSFERYFYCDHASGTIEVNPRAPLADQARAEFTLRYFRLNHADHFASRKREKRRRETQPDQPLDDFAYRFYVEG